MQHFQLWEMICYNSAPLKRNQIMCGLFEGVITKLLLLDLLSQVSKYWNMKWPKQFQRLIESLQTSAFLQFYVQFQFIITSKIYCDNTNNHFHSNIIFSLRIIGVLEKATLTRRRSHNQICLSLCIHDIDGMRC